jgi:predicted  nucleic acid-binding Zn-ribbon protein
MELRTVMESYKSPASRLARLFHSGRERWKQRALEKQKQVRSLEVKVRDLGSSRDHWKERARNAEAELKALQKASASASRKKTMS